jgi:hypothetical protein
MKHLFLKSKICFFTLLITNMLSGQIIRMGQINTGEIIDIEEYNGQIYALTQDGIYARTTTPYIWSLRSTLRLFNQENLGGILDFQVRKDVFFMKVNDSGLIRYYVSKDKGSSWAKLSVPSSATNFASFETYVKYRDANKLYTVDISSDVVTSVDLVIGPSVDSDLEPIDGAYYYISGKKLCQARIEVNKIVKKQELITMPSDYKNYQILTWERNVYLWGKVDTNMVLFRFDPAYKKITEQLRVSIADLGANFRLSKSDKAIYLESRNGGITFIQDNTAPYWVISKKVTAGYTRFVGRELFADIMNCLHLSNDLGDNFMDSDLGILSIKSGTKVRMEPNFTSDWCVIQIQNVGAFYPTQNELFPIKSEVIGNEPWDLYAEYQEGSGEMDTLVLKDSQLVFYFRDSPEDVVPLPDYLTDYHILKVYGSRIVLSNGNESFYSVNRGINWKKAPWNGKHQYVDFHEVSFSDHILVVKDNKLYHSTLMEGFTDISFNLSFDFFTVDKYFYANEILYSYQSWTGKLYRLDLSNSRWESVDTYDEGWGKYWYLPYRNGHICCIRETGHVGILEQNWTSHSWYLPNLKVYEATSNAVCIMATTNNGIWGIILPKNFSSITDHISPYNTYPNPTDNSITVDLNGQQTPDNLRVKDLMGNIVEPKITPYSDRIDIDLSQCKAGTYILHYEIQGKNYHQKIIKL